MYLLYLIFLLLGKKLELIESLRSTEIETGKELSDYLQTGDSPSCTRKATCIFQENISCMGTILPYSGTTLELLPEYSTLGKIKVYLKFKKPYMDNLHKL